MVNQKSGGEKIAGLEMADLEALGHVKFDVLGLTLLDKIMRIEELINEHEPDRYEKALERVCRIEVGEDRGAKRRAVFTEDQSTAVDRDPVTTCTESRSSSSAQAGPIDMDVHAHTDVTKSQRLGEMRPLQPGPR